MKKIGIDISHYGKKSGYGIVTDNIIKGILEQDKKNFYYLFSNEKKDLSDLKYYKNLKFINLNKNFIRYKFFLLPKELKRNKIDVFFSLDQELPLKKVCKYICISHDIGAQMKGKGYMIKTFFKKGTNKLDRIYHLLNLEKIALKKADNIFCPSENTKNDLIKKYNIQDNKIIVNYRGMDHLNSNKKKNKKDYILFPFSNLYDDFQYKLANEIIRMKLINKVIFLRPAYINPDIELSKNIIIQRERISDSKLSEYYKSAEISVYLSDYDGFGFVPLESAHYKTPVIYNIHSCMKEINKSAGIGIEELDIHLFTKAIKRVLGNTKTYDILVEKGLNNLKRFTWGNCVKKFLNILSEDNE